MGMAASQARLLSLQARMNNIEYQGQQINQERTVLSQQATALYNSLLTIDIPTPPTTTEFTKVVYSGVDGASNFTLGNVIPTDSTYSIEFKYQKTGNYVDYSGTAAAIGAPTRMELTLATPKSPVNYYETSGSTKGLYDPTTGTGTVPQPDNIVMEYVDAHNSGYTPSASLTYYALVNNQFIEISAADINGQYVSYDIYTKTDGASYSAAYPAGGPDHSDDPTKDYELQTGAAQKQKGGYTAAELINSFYFVDGGTFYAITSTMLADTNKFTQLDDGSYVLNSSTSLNLAARSQAQRVPEGDTTSGYLNGDKNDLIGIVADKSCYSLTKAIDLGLIATESVNPYIEAIRNAFSEYSDTETYSDDDIKELFGVYFTRNESGRNVPHFVITSEVLSSIGNADDNHWIPTYDYNEGGKYTATEQKKNCLLTFDASGRITEVKIPATYAADGSVATYKTVKLEAATTTDEDAYQDAYAKYEYAQYEYDKKQQEINAKTEIIQKEDKNLELKLTRLDNERTALKTEMEAVKKVIDENIENSFKTFSG